MQHFGIFCIYIVLTIENLIKMKKMALLGLGIFLTVSCAKTTNQESQVSDVSTTPCVQTKAGDGNLDRVDVEFTEKGVQITHYGFEVTCDFTTVNVTHTFLNGVLNITQQGAPNNAKCKCYTDVSYTIEGLSQGEVNVIFINGIQVYCYNDKDDDSLVFNYQFVVGGRLGGYSNLTINSDSTHYVSSYRELQSAEVVTNRYETTVKTSKEQWDYLTKAFDLGTFKKIESGACGACVDATDEIFSVTVDGETYSFTNGKDDVYYQEMKDFFDAVKNIIDTLHYNDNDNQCEEIACSKIFMLISFKLEYPNGQPVLLDSSKVFWINENRFLEQNLFSWNEARVWGRYLIVDDGMRKELYNREEVMRFTGYISGEAICEWDVLVGADCCHVSHLGSESLTQVIPFISTE